MPLPITADSDEVSPEFGPGPVPISVRTQPAAPRIHCIAPAQKSGIGLNRIALRIIGAVPCLQPDIRDRAVRIGDNIDCAANTGGAVGCGSCSALHLNIPYGPLQVKEIDPEHIMFFGIILWNSIHRNGHTPLPESPQSQIGIAQIISVFAVVRNGSGTGQSSGQILHGRQYRKFPRRNVCVRKRGQLFPCTSPLRDDLTTVQESRFKYKCVRSGSLHFKRLAQCCIAEKADLKDILSRPNFQFKTSVLVGYRRVFGNRGIRGEKLNRCSLKGRTG